MELNPILKRILGVLAALIVLIFAIVWFSGAETKLKLAKPVSFIGPSTSILVEADAPHGVKAFSAVLEQGGPVQKVGDAGGFVPEVLKGEHGSEKPIQEDHRGDGDARIETAG